MANFIVKLIDDDDQVSDSLYYGDGYANEPIVAVLDVPRQIIASIYQGLYDLSMRAHYGDEIIGECLVTDIDDYFNNCRKAIKKYSNSNNANIKKYIQTIQQCYQVELNATNQLRAKNINKIAYVSGLTILAAYRQKGMAHTLVQINIGYLRSLGYQAIIFSVSSDYSRAIAVKMGAKCIYSFSPKDYVIAGSNKIDIYTANL